MFKPYIHHQSLTNKNDVKTGFGGIPQLINIKRNDQLSTVYSIITLLSLFSDVTFRIAS